LLKIIILTVFRYILIIESADFKYELKI